MKRHILALLAAAVLLVPATSSALPIVWGVNGNSYEAIAVPGGITWAAAQAQAVAMGGHLATITSAAENAFIYTTVFGGVAQPYWLGGSQPAGSPEPAGGWTWVTGEPWAYTNWDGGEPNNVGGNENALVLWTAGKWNDAPAAWLYPNGGYVVEIEAIPEPTTLGLLGLGLSFVLLRSRKSAK